MRNEVKDGMTDEEHANAVSDELVGNVLDTLFLILIVTVTVGILSSAFW